jgi:hypothetical protein
MARFQPLGHWTRGHSFLLASSPLIAAAFLAASGCANVNPSPEAVFTEAGLETVPGSGGATGTAVITSDAGQSLRTFTAPADPGANGVYITISGESNALSGYPFPPQDWVNDTYMFDGWEFVIEEYIVVVDHIGLWNGAETNTHDPEEVGSEAAHVDGPFVVDLHKGGTLIGQGGAPEEATPLAVITRESDQGGAPLQSSVPYAFGFSTVPATYNAFNVNLDASEAADFSVMVANGYSVFYRGITTWKGNQAPNGCTQTSTGPGPEGGIAGQDGGDAGTSTFVDGGYDFTRMPNSGLSFALGFSTPTNYVNCQNQSLQGTPNPGEAYPRGVQISPSQSAIAQVTLHMDHPFWESFAEDSPVHWDQIAAQYIGVTNPEAHVEDMKGVAFYAFTDATGTPLPWRNCAGQYYMPPGNGQMAFSTLSVPIDPQGTCTGDVGDDYTQDHCPAIRDYYDYMRFTQSTQGHLNSQGLCFIDRRYPAPAGGS